MRVVHGDPSGWELEGRHVVSIGVYDGVHRGHRHVLGMVTGAAADRGDRSAVLTFDRHPLAVVAPERAPRLLTTLGRRIELFGEIGLDVTGVLAFQRHVRDLSPEAFVGDILVGIFRASVIVIGEGFRFGRDRAGDVASLREFGERWDFEVDVVDLVDGDGPLSSTRIRTLIADGDVVAAAEALGRPFELPGRVVRGEGRGAKIGVPTANLDVPLGLALPARGVYAVRVEVPGAGAVPAVANVGVRPTFGGTRETFEVHLLDRDDDLYGSDLRVGFESRIRDERKFSSVEALITQIDDDIAEARRRLS